MKRAGKLTDVGPAQAGDDVVQIDLAIVLVFAVDDVVVVLHRNNNGAVTPRAGIGGAQHVIPATRRGTRVDDGREGITELRAKQVRVARKESHA